LVRKLIQTAAVQVGGEEVEGDRPESVTSRSGTGDRHAFRFDPSDGVRTISWRGRMHVARAHPARKAPTKCATGLLRTAVGGEVPATPPMERECQTLASDITAATNVACAMGEYPPISSAEVDVTRSFRQKNDSAGDGRPDLEASVMSRASPIPLGLKEAARGFERFRAARTRPVRSARCAGRPAPPRVPQLVVAGRRATQSPARPRNFFDDERLQRRVDGAARHPLA